MRSLPAFALIALPLCGATACAVVLRVPQVYPTIGHALAVNQTGDTVEVAPGDYHTTQQMGLDQGVTLRAAQASTTRLIMTESAILFSNASWPAARVENLELRKLESVNGIVVGHGSLIELSSCRLVGSGPALDGSGQSLVKCVLDSLAVVCASENEVGIVFFDCRLSDCGTIDDTSHPNLIMEKCLLERCDSMGNLGWVPYDEGMIALHGCTLSRCGNSAAFFGTSLDRLELTRCIVDGLNGSLLWSGNMVPDQLELTNTDIWGGILGDWTGPLQPFFGYQGNISTDPLFCDPASGNFRLAWDSPCVLDAESGDVMGALPPGCGPRILACTAEPDVGRIPLEVAFTCSLDDSSAAVDWDFTGDGVADTAGLQTTWTFRHRGEYGVTMHTWNAAGEVVLDTLVIHVEGADIHVPEDAFWLENALAQALPGDVVWLAAGSYPCHDLVVPPGVSIMGVSGATVLDAEEQGRCLTVQAGACDTELTGLDFIGGRAGQGGALLLDSSDPDVPPVVRVSNCLFRTNRAQSLGGAIAVAWQGPRLVLDSCRFLGNVAGWGGACYGGALWARSCRLEDNQAGLGGALAGQDSLDLEGCVFVGNRATDQGGALSTLGTGASRVASCLFLRNRAGQDGAALWDEGSALVSHCSFWGDSTAATGAVLWLGGAAPRLEGSIVANATGGRALGGSPSLVMTCTDLWANTDGDWTPPWDGQMGQRGNLHDDPLFCDPAAEDFGLMVFSPCSDLNSPCGLMGASAGLCEFSALEPTLPQVSTLAPPWPNPFNPTTTLAFTLARSSEADLRVCNLAGQEVAVLVRGPHYAGAHQARFDGSACAAGLYFAVLETAEGRAVRKLLLVR